MLMFCSGITGVSAARSAAYHYRPAGSPGIAAGRPNDPNKSGSKNVTIRAIPVAVTVGTVIA